MWYLLKCPKWKLKGCIGGSTFNVSKPSEYNGKCYDLGVHHLGLLPKNVKLVKELNDAGYGLDNYYGLPVYEVCQYPFCIP